MRGLRWPRLKTPPLQWQLISRLPSTIAEIDALPLAADEIDTGLGEEGGLPAGDVAGETLDNFSFGFDVILETCGAPYFIANST